MTYLFARCFLLSILFHAAFGALNDTKKAIEIEEATNTTIKEEANNLTKEEGKSNIGKGEGKSNIGKDEGKTKIGKDEGKSNIGKQEGKSSIGKEEEIEENSVLSQEEKHEILRLHNEFRSKTLPAAANMRLMRWDLVAEKSAQAWAEYCTFERGMAKGYEKTPMGRNVYVGRNFTVAKATIQWWNQSINYNYWTKCKPGTRCGSYTQMMWATTDRVGCGIFACPKWNLFVCHYEPAGNYIGLKPYEAGIPCSQCDTNSGGRCHQNLCVTNEECKTLGLTCFCSLQCRHCGVFDRKNCQCNCKDGWDSLDCSKRCENAHGWCLQNSGSRRNTSCLEDSRIKNTYCRSMCGQCAPAPPGNPTFMYDPAVPGGIKCPEKFYYDQTTCECVFTE